MNLREYIKERWLQFIMLLAVLTVVILFGVLVMIPNFYLLLVGVSFVSITGQWKIIWHILTRNTCFPSCWNARVFWKGNSCMKPCRK